MSTSWLHAKYGLGSAKAKIGCPIIGSVFSWGGKLGPVQILGKEKDSGLLVAESLATGERFYTLPVVVKSRRRFENPLEILAAMSQ